MATAEANLVILAVWSLFMNFKTFAASMHLGARKKKNYLKYQIASNVASNCNIQQVKNCRCYDKCI
jgi:hypothetical protein